MPEKPRKSRFFRIKKEGPEEEEVKEEVEEVEEAPEKEGAEKPGEGTAEKLVKETLGEEEAEAPEAEEKPEVPERLRPAPPTPRKLGVPMQVKEDIYRLRGTLKTLEGKLDRKEISPEEYEKKSKKLNLMLADLYEKKIKRELGI